MSFRPEIPKLLEIMKRKLKEAKERNPGVDYKTQEVTIKSFENLYEDYLYYVDHSLKCSEANQKLYEDNRAFMLAFQVKTNDVVRLSKENEELKSNIN